MSGNVVGDVQCEQRVAEELCVAARGHQDGAGSCGVVDRGDELIHRELLIGSETGFRRVRKRGWGHSHRI